MTVYPSIELDPVQKLRTLAAALPHAVYAETVFDASFGRVWGLVGDLEHGTQRFERGVRSARILSREADTLELEAVGLLGIRSHFDVVLRPGWCIMRSRIAQVGMAAVSEPDGRTRFGHFEQVRAAGWLLRPVLRANIANDFVRIAEILRAPAG